MYDKEKFLTKRDFYDQYWRCRDFEIKNLWQRSIFLGTFLILCYTAYGAFFGKAFLEGNFCVNLTKWEFHVIACILALIGATFAILWIAMAKGSKAWFENYEKAIVAIEKELVSIPCEKLYSGFECRHRPFFYGVDLDDSIYSSKGGAYSPSKINIVLGQLSLAIWMSVFAFHTAIALTYLFFCHQHFCFCCCDFAIFKAFFVLAIITFVLLVIVPGSKKILGIFDIASGTIADYSNKRENLYSKNLSKLPILEKIYDKVKNQFEILQFDVVEDGGLYLVFLLDCVYEKSLKLDVCVEDKKISLCIKRTDNEAISENDAIDKFLKTKIDGKIERGCYRIIKGNGSGSFEIEEGVQKIFEVINVFRA